MPIPNAPREVPPPLPPPRYVGDFRDGQDPGWKWGNTNSATDTGFGGPQFASVPVKGSLLGGGIGSGHAQRDTSAPYGERGGYDADSLELSDEDRSGLSRPPLNHR